MSVLEIVLLAVVGEFGLGVAIGTFLRGPRPQALPISAPRHAGLRNVEKSPVLIQH